jgi:hypothetical protein
MLEFPLAEEQEPIKNPARAFTRNEIISVAAYYDTTSHVKA